MSPWGQVDVPPHGDTWKLFSVLCFLPVGVPHNQLGTCAQGRIVPRCPGNAPLLYYLFEHYLLLFLEIRLSRSAAYLSVIQV